MLRLIFNDKATPNDNPPTTVLKKRLQKSSSPTDLQTITIFITIPSPIVFISTRNGTGLPGLKFPVDRFI